MMRLGLQTALHGLRQPRLLTIGTGNGTTTSFTQPPQVTPGTAIYVNDWQGNQLQYSTPRTNLTEYSDDQTQAVWVPNNVSVSGGIQLAPDGVSYMDKLVENTVTNVEHYIEQVFTAAAGTWTMAWILYPNGRRYGSLTAVHVGESGGNVSYAFFDLTAGTILPGNGRITNQTITALAGGYFLVTATFTTTTACTSLRSRIELASAQNSGGLDYTGDGVSGFFVWRSQFVAASTVGSFIKTTTAPVTVTDYSLSGGNVVFAVAPPSSAAITATA